MAGSEMFILTTSILPVGPPILLFMVPRAICYVIMLSELEAGHSIPFSDARFSVVTYVFIFLSRKRFQSGG